jgi:hypothetical protein
MEIRIQATNFHKFVDTEPSQPVQDYKEGNGGKTRPPTNEDKSVELGGQKRSIETPRILAQLVEEAALVGNKKGCLHKIGIREESGRNKTPSTTEKMNRNGVDSIVDTETDQQMAPKYEEKARHDSCETSAPAIHSKTPRCDRDKAAESAVHGIGKIPG